MFVHRNQKWTLVERFAIRGTITPEDLPYPIWIRRGSNDLAFDSILDYDSRTWRRFSHRSHDKQRKTILPHRIVPSLFVPRVRVPFCLSPSVRANTFFSLHFYEFSYFVFSKRYVVYTQYMVCCTLTEIIFKSFIDSQVKCT